MMKQSGAGRQHDDVLVDGDDGLVIRTVPSISLACPGLGRMPAFATAPGFRSEGSEAVLLS
jgi:hypothetical protein